VVDSGGHVPTFHGKYYNAIDTKGRVMVPAPFRDIIKSNYSTKLYITNAPTEECLNIYPQEEWQKLLDKISKLPPSDRSVKKYRYRVIASAHDCELDKQGRILVPSSLRTDGKLDSEIAVVGQINWIQIWDKNAWENMTSLTDIDGDYEDKLAELGL
jgi:MraZ protein